MQGGRATQWSRMCAALQVGRSVAVGEVSKAESVVVVVVVVARRASREVVCSASANVIASLSGVGGRGDPSQQVARDGTQWPRMGEGARGNAPREQR